MLKLLRKLFPETGFIRLAYHKLKGVLANLMYFNPSRKMIVIGVTGTDGKTTTSNLLASFFTELGYKVGMSSTVCYRILDKTHLNLNKMTTDSPFKLQKLIKSMKKAGVELLVLEVSSHAVLQNRIWGINFDIGVLTNITEDHIEYHGSMEEYYMTKYKFLASLHSMRRKSGLLKTVVLNADDQFFNVFSKIKSDNVYNYGLQSKKAVIKASDVFCDNKSLTFTVNAPNIKIDVKNSMVGEFNVYNLLAVASCGLALGADQKEIQKALNALEPVKGRMQIIDCGQDYTVVSDYAHAVNALNNVCSVFKPLTKGKLTIVFGCTGGGRDKRKRPEMGAVASKFADRIILTSDDPYEEDPYNIIQDIKKGINGFDVENLHEIIDRKMALEFAISKAQKGDTILVAGKGGEKVTIINGQKLPFDEEAILREIISKQEFDDVAY